MLFKVVIVMLVITGIIYTFIIFVFLFYKILQYNFYPGSSCWVVLFGLCIYRLLQILYNIVLLEFV
jgi:hypothetical protein